MSQQRQSYQRGDALTVVLVVVVIAIAGLLGFIAWKNIAEKDKTANTVETTDTTDATQDKSAQLNIKEWGISLQYDNTKDFGAKSLAYNIDKEGVVSIYPDNQTYQANKKCEGDMSVGVVRGHANDTAGINTTFADMYRSKDDEKTKADIFKINDYYYNVFYYGVGECEGEAADDNTTDSQLKTLQAVLADSFKSLE